MKKYFLHFFTLNYNCFDLEMNLYITGNMGNTGSIVHVQCKCNVIHV